MVTTKLQLNEHMKTRLTIVVIFATLHYNALASGLLATEAEEKCFFKMLYLWNHAVSYIVLENKAPSEVLPSSFITNLVSKTYVAPMCPSGSVAYPGFTPKDGPRCPNGHLWNSNSNVSYDTLVSFLKQSKEQFNLVRVTNALMNRSIVIRRVAMRMLPEYESEAPEAVRKLLLGALDDLDHVVRSIALDSCRSLKREDAIKMLVKAITNHDPYVRVKAIKTVNNMRAKDLLPHLIRALDDSAAEVRKEAQSALEKITGVQRETSEQWKKWWDSNQKGVSPKQ